MVKMQRMLPLFLLLALIATAPAGADKNATIVVAPVTGAPQWQMVPNVPGVQYAPNLAQDIFRFQNNLYYWSQGQWFQGRSQMGPWQPVTTLPPAMYQVQAPYFKSPPGWAKGKKTGWQGQPLPPGQMKKMEKGMPPGQMKKMK
jgi:hypothetical protein